MAYTIGDIPAAPLVVAPVRTGPDGEYDVDLAPYDTVTATLYSPEFTEAATLDASITADTITVQWPASTPFETAGMYRLRLVAESTAGAHETMPDVRLIVDDPSTGWHTIETARADWPSAPGFDAWLHVLLETAKQQVLDYAPALAAGQHPPANYQHAQLLQARNSWNAAMVDPSTGGLGEDSFIITPHPLDWHIKQVLRPKRAVPTIG